MSDTTLDLGGRAFIPQLADLVRDARRLAGWTQAQLASRARTSQATISRLESGAADTLDLRTVERTLEALGLRPTLGLEQRHLADRRRQADGIHALINGAGARWLERNAWQTGTEVEVGRSAPRGWIDLLAFRPADAALLVQETKGDLPDAGALQRSVAFYEREAPYAARRRGWIPARTHVLVVALDSATIARRIAANRDLLTGAFPARVEQTASWLADPRRPAPGGWTIAMADPASRADAWLRPTPLESRRRSFAYEDYADAARRLLRG